MLSKLKCCDIQTDSYESELLVIVIEEDHLEEHETGLNKISRMKNTKHLPGSGTYQEVVNN